MPVSGKPGFRRFCLNHNTLHRFIRHETSARTVCRRIPRYFTENGSDHLKAELLDQNTVKIILTAGELADSGLSYRTLDDQTPGARSFLFSLLCTAGAQLKKNLCTGHIRIEAYPYADGGCILFVSHSPPETEISAPPPVVCCFSSVRMLIKQSGELSRLLPQTPVKSTLYRLKHSCILLLFPETPLEKELAVRINAADVPLFKSPFFIPLLREYGELLIETDALTKLGALS